MGNRGDLVVGLEGTPRNFSEERKARGLGNGGDLVVGEARERDVGVVQVDVDVLPQATRHTLNPSTSRKPPNPEP